ncbi:glycosyltransferase [Silicimonas sp. MF1-12-2]|uniref:glycosyltransferase n=1 Tax=Silicimonas sp. MF1-12-2 TaxID=3384793 RepID=UPI0039B4021D
MATTIVVPVFNAADDLARLLDRLAATTNSYHTIVLIDDGSDDPRINRLLRSFAVRFPTRVIVETFEVNHGFVAAINHGFETARDLEGHIIILNTDTLPPDGWVGRLLAPIASDPNVASVTPVSNTAEIASVPAQGVETKLGNDLVDRIDRVARNFAPAWRDVDIPTGIGFAMAINRAFLEKIGGFDSTFGRGYGEEVDWCQRARAAGGRHVLATSVFVGHSGSASFGTAEKQERTQANNRIISARYPGYDRVVKEWAETSPHAVQRCALTVAWLDAVSVEPVPVFIGHVLGGGAEVVLRRQVDEALERGAPGIVILRTGGTTPWRIEIEAASFKHVCRVQDIATLLALLAPIARRRVIYSCGVGARDPRNIPEVLLSLTSEETHSLELLLHDYFVISPSYCLLDSHGRYRGVPLASGDDPAHCLPAIADRHRCSLAEWSELWRPVIARAQQISAFSNASAVVFREAYPEVGKKLVVTPHTLPDDLPAKLSSGGTSIGILGGINLAKGAGVLVSLAREIKASGSNRKIVIIGDLDPNYRLPVPHRTTGRYERADITRLARQHGVGLWLIPSIWPETFSFTTREALATGLPVLTFDLGAQGEASGVAPNGHVLDCHPDDVAGLLKRIEALFGNS